MKNTLSPHIPFQRLSLEARALFFLYAMAAWAPHQSHCPTPAELKNSLEAVWDVNELT